jgi:hypothetical protein
VKIFGKRKSKGYENTVEDSFGDCKSFRTLSDTQIENSEPDCLFYQGCVKKRSNRRACGLGKKGLDNNGGNARKHSKKERFRLPENRSLKYEVTEVEREK